MSAGFESVERVGSALSERLPFSKVWISHRGLMVLRRVISRYSFLPACPVAPRQSVVCSWMNQPIMFAGVVASQDVRVFEVREGVSNGGPGHLSATSTTHRSRHHETFRDDS